MVFETSLLLLRFDLRSEIKFRFERVVETQQVIIIRQMYKEEVENENQTINHFQSTSTAAAKSGQRSKNVTH